MFIRRVAAVVGAGIVLAAAIPTFVDAAQQFQGVLVKNTDADPVRTQEAGTFSSHVFIRTTNGLTPACFELPLPDGPVVVEHLDAQLGIDAEAYLRIPTATDDAGTPEPIDTLGELYLPATRGNIQSDRTMFTLASALRLEGEFVAVDGVLFHTPTKTVQLCAFDDDPNMIGLGSAIVSGRTLR